MIAILSSDSLIGRTTDTLELNYLIEETQSGIYVKVFGVSIL